MKFQRRRRWIGSVAISGIGVIVHQLLLQRTITRGTGGRANSEGILAIRQANTTLHKAF